MSEMDVKTAVDSAIDWKQRWASLSWPWRTEPEIDDERKAALAQRWKAADGNALDDPFANYELTRADIEWMLATHDSGKGPVVWDDLTQRQRTGINLKGALMAGINLNGLPMARTLFMGAHLEQSTLVDTHIEGANIAHAHFEGARLVRACAQFAHGRNVNMQGALLYKIQAQEAVLPLARFEAADLRLANFQNASLRNAHFAGAVFMRAQFEGADCTGSFFAPSVDSTWEQVRASIPSLPEHLQGADLRGVFFDSATSLAGSVLFNLTSYQTGVQLADVHWGDVNVAAINWNDQLPDKGPLLGDELAARRLLAEDSLDALMAMMTSVRASRQLAVVLRDQGLNEEADKFAYRAQNCQKQVLYKQKQYGRYLLSQALDMIAGYGYLPLRTLYTYVGIIFTFSVLYLLASQFTTPHLSWDEAIVLSMSSFHGRGFFNQQVQLGDAYARLAALEALIGLLTEVSFIATFTQRFLGK